MASDFERLVEQASEKDQRGVLAMLLRRFPIHEIEQKWGAPAGAFLEAIDRSPPLSQRMFRGLLAEGYFATQIVPSVNGWDDDTPDGDHAFDFRLRRGDTVATIQVKAQRKKDMRPMFANEGYRWLPSDQYVAETQRSRAGKDSKGNSTRPYRFGEFDILAVGMEPATGRWDEFRYTLERWLIPDLQDLTCLLKFQPVSLEPSQHWTDDIHVALDWLISGETRPPMATRG